MKRTPLPNGWYMVDDSDVLEVEVGEVSKTTEPPVSYRFPSPIHAPDGEPADVASVLRAADDACRRMEVLARELECLVDPTGDGDGDGPRAA